MTPNLEWTEVERLNLRNLRLATARLKATRLDLPTPGSLLRVMNGGALKIYNDAVMSSTNLVMCGKGTRLLLISVNPLPSQRSKHAVESTAEIVELIVMLGTILLTTEPRDVKVIKHWFEVV